MYLSTALGYIYLVTFHHCYEYLPRLLSQILELHWLNSIQSTAQTSFLDEITGMCLVFQNWNSIMIQILNKALWYYDKTTFPLLLLPLRISMIIRCNLSNLLWGFNKTDMANKRLGVNVSFHQHRLKTPFLGDLPLRELNISWQIQSFTGLIEPNKNWFSEKVLEVLLHLFWLHTIGFNQVLRVWQMYHHSHPANPPATWASCHRLDLCKWSTVDYCHM